MKKDVCKNKGITIYIPVEVKKREWLAKMVLATLCLKNGYNVVIGDHGFVRDYAVTQKNGVYIEKDFFHIRLRELAILKRKGFKIIGLDEEGLVKGDERKYGAIRLDKDVLQICDIVMAWGNKEKKEMISVLDGEDINKIYTIGNPRIDLLRNRGRRLYGSLKYKRPQILVVSDFDLITTKDSYKKSVEVIKSHVKDATLDMEQLNEVYAFMNYIFPLFVEAIQYLAKFDIADIIIRPHPQEDDSVWKEYFKEYHNVAVTNEYDANLWIKSADVMIHTGSTTAIESLIMGKPSVVFMPQECGFHNDDGIIFKSSIRANNKEELYKIAERFVKGDNKKKIWEEYNGVGSQNYIRDYVSFDKKSTCSQKIVDIINGFEWDQSGNKVSDKKKQNACRDYGYEFKRFCINKFSKKSGNPKFPNTYIWDVKKTISNIMKTYNFDMNVEVEVLENKNLFYLSSKDRSKNANKNK